MGNLSPTQITWIYTFGIFTVAVVSFFIAMIITTIVAEVSKVRQARWAAFGQTKVELEKYMEDLK